MTSTSRLAALGMPVELASEVATQIADAGAAPVTSVNGETGTVVLDASDVGAVAIPDTLPAYSETGADLAAALVAAGLMEADT